MTEETRFELVSRLLNDYLFSREALLTTQPLLRIKWRRVEDLNLCAKLMTICFRGSDN